MNFSPDNKAIRESMYALLDCNGQVVKTLHTGLLRYNPALDPRPEKIVVHQVLDKSYLENSLIDRWKRDETELVRLLIASGIPTNPASAWNKMIHIFPYANQLPRKADAIEFLESRQRSFSQLQSSESHMRLGIAKVAGLTIIHNLIMRGALFANTYILPTPPGRFSPN